MIRVENFSILGANGSRKTTLLKLILGFLPYKRGEIFINNKPLKDYHKKELANLIA
ncbi:MAG: ABC transporter ATP-binding protein [Campylobacter sp.]|nr:ABC transporter ATP-binding protein [Campylobacter sp.]